MRILIATDGSEYSAAAVQAAAAKVDWPIGSEFRILSVAEPPPYGPAVIFDQAPSISYPAILESLRNAAEQSALKAIDALKVSDNKVSYIVRTGSPAEEIVKEAQSWSADLIMMGTHGRSAVVRMLLGSVAGRVKETAPCQVEIVTRFKQRTKAAGSQR